MWPTWWWPQALMQPEILIFSSPMSCWRFSFGEALGDPLGHRDRTGVGQVAVVQPRAGDDVGDQTDVGGGKLGSPQSLPDRVEVARA